MDSNPTQEEILERLITLQIEENGEDFWTVKRLKEHLNNRRQRKEQTLKNMTQTQNIRKTN